MKRYLLTFFSGFAIFLSRVASVKAAATTPPSGSGDSGGDASPIFSLKNPLPSLNNLGDIFNILLSLAFFVAGVAMFFNLVIGGIQWISSGGDQKALDSARRRLTNAVVGLIIVVAAYAIALILEKVFGIRIVSGFSFS